MVSATFVLCIAAFLAVAQGLTLPTRTVSYADQQVVSCTPTTAQALKDINAFIDANRIDVWQDTFPLHLRVSSHQRTLVDRIQDVVCETMIEDVEAAVSAHEDELESIALGANTTWFDSYHNVDDLFSYYKNLTAAYPSLLTLVPSIGKSVQGRDIIALHLTSQKGPASKLKFFFQCNIHAREWISGAVCNYLIDFLVRNYETNSTVASVLDTLELVIIPVLNVDGLAYTYSNDRLWRKNLSVNKGSKCLGTDLNRNYPYHWNNGGSSTNPCDDTYMGVSAGSEPETQASVNYFRTAAPAIAAIDFHSYSQLILRPWGDTQADCQDETFLNTVGAGIQKAIKSVTGFAYTNEKSIGLYPTSGTASDFFYADSANNKGYRSASYTIELRDTGKQGFLLSPTQIIPNGEEILGAFLYFANYIAANPIQNK